MAENNLGKGNYLGDYCLHYENHIEICPFAILIAKDNFIHYSNGEAFRLLKLDWDQIRGKLITDLINVNIEQSSGNIAVDKLVRADGSEVYVEILVIFQDICDEKITVVILKELNYWQIAEKIKTENEQLNKRLAEILSVHEMKNDFFSNLSHELRTPLNVIMSTIQLIESLLKNTSDSKVVSKIEKYIGIMKQNCFRQLRLINNIIDITKIDSGFYELKKRNYDIVHIVENITLSVSEYIKSKSIDLLFDTDMEEKIIACDGDKIERIMLNLLSNAIKFTSEGGEISVTMYDKGETVIISVKDSGIGIPEDKLNLVFNRFMQVNESLTRNYQGSGIGLSLVKSLVELHGGRISVISELGKGSEFIIELPVTTVLETEGYMKEETDKNSFVEKINLEFSDIYKIN